MAFEKRELQGSIFYNDKQNDKQPDLKGYVIINQVEYELALWAGREGSKQAYSVKAQVKTERRDAQPEQSISQRAMPKGPVRLGPNDDMNDDVPF